MRIRRYREIKASAAAVLALALVTGLPPQRAAAADEDPVAEIQSVVVNDSPQPEVSDITQAAVKRIGTGVSEPAKVGMKLFKGDEVTTGEPAQLGLLFTEPDTDERIEVFLNKNSHIQISSIFVFLGNLYVAGYGLFDTSTRYVRLGKRGTDFELTVTEGDAATVKVLRGEVTVEPREFDAYGDVRPGDEQARLDNFAVALQNDPTSQGYLVCYGGRRGRAGEAQRRCDRAKDYLVTTRGISADRIVTLDGGYKEELSVELWVVPPGVDPPTVRPTVDPPEAAGASAPARRARRGAQPPAPKQEAAGAKVVGPLQELTVGRRQPIPEPKEIKIDEVESVLRWTNNVILASMPLTPPQNIVPTSPTSPEPTKAELAEAFKKARRDATLNPTGDNLKALGDAYKDFGRGKNALREYGEAAQQKPELEESALFHNNRAEAYRLAGDLKQAEDEVDLAAKKNETRNDPQVSGLIFNTRGNINYDKAIAAIARKEGAEANKYFIKARSAYEEAKDKNPKYNRIVQTNLRNVELAFGPEPLTTPALENLTGTYRGLVNLPWTKGGGPAVLVITGDRFTLITCDDYLTGKLSATVTRGVLSAMLQFEQPGHVKSVGLQAILDRQKRLTLTSAPGERFQFDFSTAQRAPRDTCTAGYRSR